MLETLEKRYQAIQDNFETLSDFSEKSLKTSRQLFTCERDRIVPKSFDVWTILVGLPLPNLLTESFNQLCDRVSQILPTHCRLYQVWPQNYHWEVFIIQRPPEQISLADLKNTSQIVQSVLSQIPPFSIAYRGFLITPDGTILVKGYATCDRLRQQLREQLPWASVQQSQLVHISLGRILDPVGYQNFRLLKTLVQNALNEDYGEMIVQQVKYVHESRWYMEKQEIITEIPLGQSRSSL